MRIAITGGRGQLGRVLEPTLAPHHTLLIVDVPEYDVASPTIIPALAAFAPDLVIHAAAMTDVDGCARDPAQAFRINALGTQNVALACQRAHAALLYISTNEVFDGEKTTPYLEFDAPHPVNAYGLSKYAGERFVEMLLHRFYIVRTAWLYARGGNKFPDKILAAARARGTLAVVRDEIGSPTYASDLANALARLIKTEHYGVYHLVNAGAVSRFDWAARILELAHLPDVTLTPVTLAEYPRASIPPKYSALENFAAAHALSITLRAWDEALADFFAENE
jgi:dTDP-4-dehydrorhamnose reductase